MPRDFAAGLRTGFPEPRDPHLAGQLDALTLDHAARHGWRKSLTDRTRQAIHILLVCLPALDPGGDVDGMAGLALRRFLLQALMRTVPVVVPGVLSQDPAKMLVVPEPQSFAAVLLLHDAVEAFLLLAAEHLGASTPREFVQYWDALSPARLSGGVDLTVKQGMARLNRVRVNLKHYGVQPSKGAIEKALADGTTFFAANTPLVFGVDYDQVSMADLIEQYQVRELVRKAEAATAGGDRTGAMIALSDACELLLMPRRSSSSRPSPLRFGDSVRLAAPGLKQKVSQALEPPRDTRGIDIHGWDRQFAAEHISTLTDTVAALQEAARVTALGIDYAAYLRFSRLIPIHSDNIRGVREYRAPTGYAPTSNDVEFCYQFVVSASLRLTEAHAHLELPSWLAGGTRPWEERWETIATGQTPHGGYL